MIKIIFISFFSIIFLFSVHAELVFSGSLRTNASFFLAFPYTDDRFTTLINPDNFMGLTDVQLSNLFTAKIEGNDETSFFSLWFGFNTYRIAEALYAAAAGDPIQTITLTETLPFLGSEIGSVELLRANISFYATDSILFKFGRQQMHTGYGYGWNPVDFANPLKDPYNPRAELRGVDAVKMTVAVGNIFSSSVSGIYAGEYSPNGILFEDVMLLSENTLYLTNVEFMVNGLYEYDEEEGNDTTPSALGIGFKLNLFDIGFYGEGAARFGSRNYYYDSPFAPVDPVIKTKTIFSALGGIEYVFPNELMLVAEYFYNGEGFCYNEKDYYEANVESTTAMFGYPASGQLTMIVPGYLNYHYILCNLLYPFYDLNMDVQLLALFSPDALMLNLLPRLTFTITGSFTLSAGYTGLFDFDGQRINEASLSPVKHMVVIEGEYFF